MKKNMKKKWKTALTVGITFVLVFYLNISTTFLRKQQQRKYFKVNEVYYEEEEFDVERNWLCEAVDLSTADAIAARYLRNDTGRVECDIMNGTEFVQISLEAGSSYQLKLNIDELMRRTKVKEKNVFCSVEKFDKAFNESEGLLLTTLNQVNLTRSNNYTVTVDEHGFYHVSCVSASNRKFMHYEDSYYILPQNMTKLIEERRFYKALESKAKYPLSYEFDEDNIRLSCEEKKMHLKKKMNVLIFGIDSLSYEHFQRIMPHTFGFLTRELKNNVMFTSMNRVGENTHPNLMPMLSGIVVDEVAVDVKSELGKFTSFDEGFYDKVPLIWHKYENAGYLTGLQQDASIISSFNYLKKGFRLKPTAFYPRPLWVKRYTSKRIDWNKCRRGRPIYRVFFDLFKTFMKLMHNNQENKDIPYFLVNFMAEYTHDDFMLPSYIDKEFTQMFRELENNGHFDNTLLILFSDHGNRIVPFSYEQDIGKVEKDLPFVSVRLPKQLWNTTFNRNLVKNKDRLLGAYDVYQTLRHFFHLNANYSKELDHSQFSVNDKMTRQMRGISLFEEIPTNRSCQDALIPDNFCSCHQRYSLTEGEFKTKTNHSFLNAASFILTHVNSLAAGQDGKCVPFKLHKIQYVTKFRNKSSHKFQFVVTFQPGNAWFEANLKVASHNSLKILGRVIRLSRYGSQGNCINDLFLRNYCFCKSY